MNTPVINQRSAQIAQIKSAGLLWARQDGCEMYVVVARNEYKWYMISETTGIHCVSNKGKYGRAYADERVLAHWDGFKINQSKN